jgi:hypothetical protein
MLHSALKQAMVVSLDLLLHPSQYTIHGHHVIWYYMNYKYAVEKALLTHCALIISLVQPVDIALPFYLFNPSSWSLVCAQICPKTQIFSIV